MRSYGSVECEFCDCEAVSDIQWHAEYCDENFEEFHGEILGRSAKGFEKIWVFTLGIRLGDFAPFRRGAEMKLVKEIERKDAI